MSDTADRNAEAHWVTGRTGLVPTAPPEVRPDTGGVLDEPTRPTVPEPGREVQFTRRGLSVGKHLIEVHDQYRAELTQIRDILRQIRTGEIDVGVARERLNAMTLRANSWTFGSFCQTYCLALTQHHTMESDGIFPYLRARDRTLAEVLDRLEEEHHAIHEVLENVDVALVALVQKPDDFTGIQDAVELLSDTLLSHFAYEERELIGPLSRFGFFDGQV